jgi:hypothetical protein
MPFDWEIRPANGLAAIEVEKALEDNPDSPEAPNQFNY